MRVLTDFYHDYTGESEVYVAEGEVNIEKQVVRAYTPYSPRDDVVQEFATVDCVSVALDGVLVVRSEETEELFDAAEEALVSECRRQMERVGEPPGL